MRHSSVVYIFCLFMAGCGDGCSCMAPIPGGFPSAERTPNAAQVRVSNTGLQAITADPAALVEGLTGGPLTFDVPASCGGTPETCCPGGNPVSPCGPIVIDLGFQAGDEPRMVITPVQGQSRIDVTIRARVHTEMDVPISAFGTDCGLTIDTAPGADPDLRVDAPISFVQDAAAGTTRVVVGDVVVTQFTDDDYEITGGFFCAGINWGSQFFIDTLTGTFADAIKGAIEDQTCKSCPSGDVAECGPFAMTCTDNVCMKPDDTCLQELGAAGRMAGGAVFGGFSPGTTGSIDLYEVLGGYGTTNSGGIALGMLGGMLPAGEDRDACGPPAAAPAPVTIPQSTFFQGNTRPDTGTPFDVAIGVHENQLDRFAYSAYDGGLLCLTVGTNTVDLLNSGSIGLFIPSLSNLTDGTVPMAIGLRPQSPPTIVLGLNTFVDDGTGTMVLDDPLLDITFTAMEIDFFASVEDQYIRLFTLVSDVHLPLGLEVGPTGELTPVLGDLEEAFTNLSAKNAEPLTETPEELADTFPLLLELALPQLAGGLGAIEVPEIGGLSISITEITAVDNVSFLAIFGELAPASSPAPARVDTVADIVDLTMPGTEVFADSTRWSKASRPRLTLALGGSEAGLEWSTRTDGGMWTAWSKNPRPAVSPHTFWLQGRHQVEVRARRAGAPLSADLTPVVLETVIDTLPPEPALTLVEGGVRVTVRDNVPDSVSLRWRLAGGSWIAAPVPFTVPLVGHGPDDLELEISDEAGHVISTRGTGAVAGPAPFHGQAGEGGCGCQSNQDPGGGVVLLLGTMLLWSRRTRKLLAALLLIVLAGSLPACNCGGDPPCGDVACMEGEVERGAIGRFNSVASDGERTVVSTYDERYGDVVLVDVTAEPIYVAVAGVPEETPVYHPSGYRGGIVGEGPDVGGWTAIGLHDGRARIAFQDRDEGDLGFAVETDREWITYEIDANESETIGFHTSMAIQPGGAPVLAYLATGVDDGAAGKKSVLRLARATNANPEDGSSWAISGIAEGPGGCGGLCGAGRACIADAAGAELCVSPASDCTSTCADSEVCYAASCTAVIEESNLVDIPRGAGLFPTVMVLSDGRLAVTHYDRVRTALVLLVETSADSSNFQETILDGADGADRGMWASAVTDGTTIHVAYQDALGDQLFYTSWNGTPGAIERVDDGLRTGDRTHPVGAGAAIYLDGGNVKVAYQDGLVSDLFLATRSGNAWTTSAIASGTLIDGFHIAATSTGPWLVWDSMDKTRSPPSDLMVREQP